MISDVEGDVEDAERARKEKKRLPDTQSERLKERERETSEIGKLTINCPKIPRQRSEMLTTSVSQFYSFWK
jgi:hypothetical protein